MTLPSRKQTDGTEEICPDHGPPDRPPSRLARLGRRLGAIICHPGITPWSMAMTPRPNLTTDSKEYIA